MSTRVPAVAGYFYPGDSTVLNDTVARLLADAPPRGIGARSLVVPHAGYVYSGPVAARAYRSLAAGATGTRRVVLLGPAHRIPVRGFALSGHDAFGTPLGQVPVSAELVRTVSENPHAVILEAAHEQEHSLEVQLPFLQTVLGDFEVLPVLVGEIGPEAVADLLDALWEDDDTLVVVSSDLSHYHDYQTASRVDRDTAQAICDLAPERIGPYEACGCRSLNGLLLLAKRKGLSVEQLDLRNSGDTAGPRDSVVGYGAFALH